MQIIKKISLSAIFLLTLAICASAQNVTVNPGAGSYGTLKDAFDAINAGTHTGAITVNIIGSTTETVPSVLNASGSGSASYISIAITPSGGAARTISGAIAAGSPMIDFNGADNVTIDGLNAGGNSLTISNTTASATSGTSTIRFIGGATGNTITNSTILGSTASSVATNGAIIFFSTDAVTANGNDNNTISNNNIGPAGANLPSKAILGNGSTTTTAIGNSGIVIDNNNIYDYFGAAVTSSGIATNGGCNTWSITNNRLYQTAARTWTTGSLHIGIDIRPTTATSGAQGFTITGNTVGYASNTQTGTYALTGAGTGAKFIGIFFNGISTGTTTNVNNNTVAAVSMTGVTASGTSTATPFTGILFQEGNGITNGNTIGSQTAAGSLTFSTTTTSAADVYGIYNFSSNAWTSNNNNIGGISITNLGASGTFLLYGMRAFTASTANWNATNNTVGGTAASPISLIGTGTASQVVGMFTSNAPMILTSNTIRNLTSNIGTGTTTAASVVGILNSSTTPNSTLSQNTIFNLMNTNTTAASVVTGIQFTGATANAVERNFIHSLSVATNAATAEVNGIRVGGGTTAYRNNMIAIGAGIPNAIGTGSTTGGINGINEPAGTNNFFHNSVYIGGAPTSGVGPSYAFNSSITANTRSFRDNIFYNGRSNAGATGKNYIVRVGGAAANPAGLTINNNIYFANGAGAVFGFFNSLDVANLAAWRTAVGQDGASFESNPQYLAPTAAVPDLHLNPAVSTVAEGNGVDVGVVLDFDGQTRASLTPVDIGADAGNYLGIDLAPPVIVYAPLANTSSTTNRTIAVTITDAGGVAGGALAPRIYYNKNAGAYVSTQCVGAAPNYVCTIDYALLGGVAGSDVIRYFVVAQDTAGNVSANPSAGFTATSVISVTTPPTVPNQYTIVPQISGTFNVGTTETYPSLTNAGGIFELINNSEAVGPITINLTSDLTTETGLFALNELPAGVSLTIKPSGAARTISGAPAVSLLKLSGADNVTIDGSLSGGTDRSLTLSATTNATLLWIGTNATSGANNNVVKNVIFSGPGAFGGQGILAGSGTTLGAAAEFPNSNNTVLNNQFSRVQNAVFAIGNVTNLDQGWQIGSNLMGSATVADKLSFRGILLSNSQGFLIAQNRISGINSSTGTSSTMSGIQIAGVINGGVITGNEIKDIRQNNTTGWGSNGIYLTSSSTAANVRVDNNMISDIASQGFNGVAAADNGYGIMVDTGGGYNFYYNTVVMNTNQVAAGSVTAALNIAAVVTTAASIDVRNNIFANTQTVGTQYSVIDSSTAGNAIFSTINNNDYFTVENVGLLITTPRVTLADWQTATGQDAASLAVDPLFVSPTDFHLTGVSPLQDTGVPIASVTVDYDGQQRGTAAPLPPFGESTKGGKSLGGGTTDIGADELLAPNSAPATISGRVTTANGQGIRNAVVEVSGGNLPAPREVHTGAFGFYSIEGLPSGQVYVVTVVSKRFAFDQPTRIIELNQNIGGADFVAVPNQ